jgi:signal transduction histidine kinase
MKPTRQFLYTSANILAGGVALISILISIGGVHKPDTLYFYLIGILTWIFASIMLLMRPDKDVIRLTYLMSVGFMVICSISEDPLKYDGTWQSLFVHIPEFISTAFLPCLFFWCFATFPSTKRFARNNFFKYVVYAPGLILFAITFISYLSGNEYTRSFFLIDIKPVLIPNFIFLFSYSIAGQLCLLHTWLHGETYIQRKQAKWIFLGINIGLIPLSIFHTIPFALGQPLPGDIGKFSAYTSIMIMVCYIIGIIRHRLMDIDLAINRSSVYAIVSSIALVFYLVISRILGEILLQVSPRSEIALELFSILIIAMLFAPLKQSVQKIIDKHFDQDRYAYHNIVHGLGEELSSVLSMDDLAEIVTSQLNKALKPEFCAIILKKGSDYNIYKNTGNTGELMKTWGNLDLDAIGYNPENVKDRHLIIPLLNKGQKTGFILLGGKVSGREYNREDMSLMKNLSYEVAIAIENATICEGLREHLKSMEEAYIRLKEFLKASNTEIILPEEHKLGGFDLISELDIIANALIGGSEKIRELDELKSQFLSDISHELRTPLASIKGYAKNLLDGVVGELNEKQIHDIERIYQNCDRLIRLINDLLNLTRIEAGKMDFRPSEVRISSLISDIVSEFMPITRKKEIMLITDYPSDVSIIADEDKLRQILTNLVDNAVKFTGKQGKIDIRAYDYEDCLQISVKDTGIGIASDNKDQVFERYHQLQNMGNGSSGIGIGLAIAKSLVEIHGGEITVISKPGVGSCFTVSIPKSQNHLV